MLGPAQIERVLAQCEKVNESYKRGEDMVDFQDNDYYVNMGWIQALKLVMHRNTAPISNKPLPNYEKAYNILMEFWNCIPENVKPDVHKELKELGL